MSNEVTKQLELIVAMNHMNDRRIDARVLLWTEDEELQCGDYGKGVALYSIAYEKWLQAVDAVGDIFPENSRERHEEIRRSIMDILYLVEKSFKGKRSPFGINHMFDIIMTQRMLESILNYYVDVTYRYWSDLPDKDKVETADNKHTFKSLDTIVNRDLIDPFEKLCKIIYESEYFQEKPMEFTNHVVNPLGIMIKNARARLLAMINKEDAE